MQRPSPQFGLAPFAFQVRKPLNRTPTVSVLMPMRNASTYVQASVESILSQTFTDFELVVIDDCSGDDSANIVSSIADHRLRLLRNAQNIGVAACLNRALASVRSPFVARMDADDVSHPDRLRQQLAFLGERPDVGVVSSACTVINDKGRPIGHLEAPVDHDSIFFLLHFFSVILHPTVMMRTQVIMAARGYSLAAPHAEDYELWLRIAPTVQIASLPTRLLCYRRHADQVGQQHRTVQRCTEDTLRTAALQGTIGRRLSRPEVLAWGVACRGEPLESEAAVQVVASLVSELVDRYVILRRVGEWGRRNVRRQAAVRLLTLARSCAPAYPQTASRLGQEARRLRTG